MSVRTMARVWELSRHKGTDLLMLLAIADFADDDGRAYPSVSTLATKCRLTTTRHAIRVLRALEVSGELEVRKNEGPKGTNLYRVVADRHLTHTPPLTPESPLTQKSAPPDAGVRLPLTPTPDEPPLNRQRTTRGTRKRTESGMNNVPDDLLPEWVPIDAWHAFVEMRVGIRKPMTTNAQTLMIARLGRLREAGNDPREVLEQAVMGSWTTLYEIKGQTSGRAHATDVMTATEQFRAGQ